MEEKIIIQGKIPNIKRIRNIIWIVGAVSSGLFVLYSIVEELQWVLWCIEEYGIEGDEVKVFFEGVFNWLFHWCGGVAFWGPTVLCLLVGGIFYWGASKITMTVTDKRVYGNTIFGKQVDLPLDMISAVGKGMFKSVAVATASGTIKFSFIENRDAIHSEISKLLVDRQGKSVPATSIKPEITQSNADELKKYKELLDSGVISQEEFDAKKKQLLGL